MNVVLRIFILAVLVNHGLGCLKKGRKKPGSEPTLAPTPPPPPPQPTLADLLGPNVQPSPYSSSGDTPQNSCDGLSCNFESSCCWTNAQPPVDQLSWVTATGQPDADKMQKNFHTATVPEGTYLLTSSTTAGGATQSAQFYSCPISCSNNDVTVKMKHWATDGVTIEVCSEQDPSGPPQNCQLLPVQNGNQDSVTIPKGQNQRIVIKAAGFSSPTGSAAMISNLEVICDPCVAETTPTTPGPTPAPSTVCRDVTCNFEDGGLCNYQSTGTAHVNFANQKPQFHNRLTGVPKSADGQSFAGCYMKAKQGEKSTLSSKTNFDKEYTIRCKYHEDAEGLIFKGCCNDDNNCPYDSKQDVQVKDYQTWRTASFNCPAGTQQVVFVGENSKGANEGAVAVDDIQVLQAASSPDSASTSACGGAAAAAARHRSRSHH